MRLLPSEQPYQLGQDEQDDCPEPLVLLRLVELGPPPDDATPVHGWRSALLAELPSIRPAPVAPVPSPRTEPARAAARVLITEAEARGLAGAMARAVLEAIEGRRPMQQLATMLSERAMATVQTMRRGGLRWPVRGATMGTVRVFLPYPDAVESFVTFHCDHRVRVLVLRIDRDHRRWLGTAVRIG
jgi:hypothetical protein